MLSALSAVVVVASGNAAVHTPWLGGLGNLPSGFWAGEPANALSIPTWVIHTSSLVEWLVAMGLAWRYADVTARPQWKGVTWGMLPLHTSGIVACTYHLFYNAPAISWCVALQAGMTCVGNTTLAIACLRLALACGWTWQMGREELEALLNRWIGSGDVAAADGAPATVQATSVARSASTGDATTDSTTSPAGTSLLGWEDLGDAWARDNDIFFLAKLAALSGGLAYAVKYAPALLQLDAWPSLPDEAVSAAALGVIVLPTLLNCAKWNQRSKEDSDFVGDF